MEDVRNFYRNQLNSFNSYITSLPLESAHDRENIAPKHLPLTVVSVHENFGGVLKLIFQFLQEGRANLLFFHF